MKETIQTNYLSLKNDPFLSFLNHSISSNQNLSQRGTSVLSDADSRND